MKLETKGKRRSKNEWESVLKRFEESGLNQSEFCRREGLNLRNFTRWMKRFRSETGTSRFVEISRSPQASVSDAATWELEVWLPGGARLRFRG